MPEPQRIKRLVCAGATFLYQTRSTLTTDIRKSRGRTGIKTVLSDTENNEKMERKVSFDNYLTYSNYIKDVILVYVVKELHLSKIIAK